MTNKDYKPTITSMLSYLDNVQYPSDFEPPRARLLELKPKDIVKWMKMKAYGTDTPPPEANPTLCRCNSLKFWKKAISFFMPNKMMKWDEVTERGNPTKSHEVNSFIALVTKKETRRQGAPSKARRPLTEGEMRQTLRLFRESPESGNISRYGLPAFITFQSSLISRIDCACYWQKAVFEAHDLFPEFAAKCRLTWSKNVYVEADAPWQIIIGPLDPAFCVLIGLAVWLEFYLSDQQPGTEELTPYIFTFSNDFSVPKGGKKSKKVIQRKLRALYNGDEFVKEKDGLVGSHSVRKFAFTRARRSGAHKDDADYRARWKQDRRTSDAYQDPELPYIDAMVAGLLSVGGPCSYRIRTNSPVTDDWILENVVPCISSSSYGRSLGKILGRALTWLIFSEKRHWATPALVDRVNREYQVLVGANEEMVATNPIEKRLLVITGQEAVLVITEVTGANTNSNNQQQSQGHQDDNVDAPMHQWDDGEELDHSVHDEMVVEGGQHPMVGQFSYQQNRQLLLSLVTQVNNLRADYAHAAEEREAERLAIMAQFRIVNSNLRQIANQPLHLLNRAAAGQDGAGVQAANNNMGGNAGIRVAAPLRRAELSPTPRTLYDLWEEWTDSIGGRKPASQFSREDRGRCKYKFCRLKIAWDRIRLLVNAGYTAQVACDRIYQVYGRSLSVTKIIQKLGTDTRNNTLHQDLVV